MKQFSMLLVLFVFVQKTKAQISYTWNGSVSTSATTAANWSPNGVPGATDNATIVTGINICVLNVNASIANLTVTTGTLDLGGNTLVVNGTNAIFTSGTVQNGTLTVSGATTTTFGSGTVTMNCIVNATSASVTFRNTTFQKAVNITKTGSSNDASSGNNTFNGPATITNAGSGHLSLANGSADQFNNTSTFNNTGSDYLYIANNSSNNIFGGVVTLNNSPTANTYILVSWYSAGTIFNNNIVVTSNYGQGVQFCGGNASASATLASGNTISAGAGGFNTGTLWLKQFTQLGATPQNVTLGGSAIMNFNGAAFNGALTAISPNIYTTNSIYNGTTVLTKTDGTSTNSSGGGNSFNAALTVNYNSNNGNGYWAFGSGAPDIYNGDVYSNNNSLDRIIFGINSTNNQFNGNFIVTQTGSAAGTSISWYAGSTSVMTVGKSISIGGAGFTSGYLALQGFTQNGNTPINLTTTGTSSIYVGGHSAIDPSVIGGTLSLTSPDIYIVGGTFNAPVSLTKTGGTSNHNQGNQNIFNSTLAVNQQSNSGYFMLGYNSNDLFNDNITLTSTGSGGIYFGWTSGTGTPALAAGKTILIGGGGFSNGFLSLNTFTQSGNAPMNLTFTGANSSLTFGNNSVIGGNLATNTPDIFFNGCTFNGTVDATKTGVGGDAASGGNIFQKTSVFTNSGSGYLMFGNGNADLFNAAATFNNTGSSNIYVAHNSSNNIFGGATTFNNTPTSNSLIYVGMYSVGTTFNDNIIVTSNNGQGVQFCGGNATATATLAAGKSLSVGAGGFSSGTLLLRQFTQTGATPQSLTLTGSANLNFGPNSAFGGNIATSSPGLFFNGCIFTGTVNSTKTGTTNDQSTGNNVFNAASIFTNSGSGYLMFGNGNADQFNAASTFNNTGSGNLYVAYNSSNNIFGGVVTFNNTPTANTVISVTPYSAGTIFNNSIVVTSTNGQGVQFCNGNATATATLAAGNTISVGAGGFSSGNLLLKQFTQVGASAQNIILSGTGSLNYGPLSSFGGDVTSISSALYLNGCNFNGATNLTKNGASGDYSQGANMFNGVCSITNSGSSFLVLGNTNPDTWNSDVTFTDNGSERLLPCWNTSGNQFNGNIFVNTSGSATGIQFCGGGSTATAFLAATKTIQPGGIGLNAGYLILKQFTQLGNAPMNLSMSSTANYLQFGPNSAIGGNVVSTSPGLFFNGCTFSGTVNSTKTGPSSDASIGNNIFNGTSIFTNAGSGYLMFGNGNSDQFNSSVTFNNTGSSNIYVAYNSSNNTFSGVATFNNTPTANTQIYVSTYSAGTIFNNNILVTSNNGQGVQFCGGNTSATASLASGKTISVGAGGFSAGTLLLKQFTQNGSSAQSLSLTGSGNLTYGPNSAFAGNVISSSPSLYFNGCIFSGTVNSTKTGTTNDQSSGNNVFNATSIFTDSGSGNLYFGNGNSDQFNATSTFNNSGSGNLYVAYNSSNNIFGGVATFNNTPISNVYILVSSYSPGTTFNSNIVVTSSNGQGVQFCSGNSSATATLSAGKTISVGAGGFSAGTLLLRQFTQVGTSAQNLVLTGSGNLIFGPTSAFGGNVTTSSPALSFNGCTFNGLVNSIKTGTTNDQSQGNNTFNGASTFTNNGTGYLLMTINAPDTYNNDVTFVKNNSGIIYPNYNNNSTYSGNMTVSSSTPVTFGANLGTATFNGAGLQNIKIVAGTPTPVFSRLVINNIGGGVNLNGTSINISNNLVLSSGLLNTTTTNILTMLNGSTVASGDATSTSYVNGPMRYQKSSAGSSILNFPIGNSPDCRPVVLTINHTNGTLYTYEAKLFNADARALGYSLPPTVDRVSGVHYYTIGRTDAAGNSQPVAGLSGNQIIQIFFNNNDVVTDGGTLTIVKNTYTAPTSWIDIGGTAGPFYVGSPNLIGSITSTSTISAFNSFSTFALADVLGGMNVLPTQVENFAGQLNNNKVDLTWSTSRESNNSYFTIEKSSDGVNFKFLQKINSSALNGNSQVTLNYTFTDENPNQGTNYYRLLGTKLDGLVTYWNVIKVDFASKVSTSVYPNPTTGNVFINGLGNNVSKIKTEWYDLSGRLLYQATTSVKGGIATLKFHLENGLYLLRYITSDGIIHEQKIIVKK